MGLPDLYPAQVGSPYTTLSAPYTSGESTMTLVDATKLPDAPNIVCLTGDVAGEFKYTGKDGNTLTGVTKLSGTPNATWPAGTYAFRGVSAYDHASIVEHLTFQRSHIVEASLDLTTNHSYSGRVLEGAEAGENLAFGDLAVLAESGKFVKANPATLATLDGTIALVVSDTIAAGSQGMFLLRGLIRNDSWTFSPGKELYASNGTPTHEPPTTGTQIIRKVGTALTATIIEFNPSSALHAEYLVSVLPVNTVSKDNNDIERKFFKDDFSVDSSSQYTGDVSSFTWDTANSKLTHTSEATDRTLSFDSGGKRLEITLQLDAIPTSGERGLWVYIDNPNLLSQRILFYGDGTTRYVKAWNATTNTDVIFNKWEAGVPFRFVVDLEEGYIQIGTYTRSFTFDVETINPQIIVLGSCPTFHIYDIASLPSISYSDDFSTDTSGRYQPVLGTVAYDDANKRMNVTTATGANGKASGRLKSYKFCEGSQIYDVLLPTGADGDFICLVTHSANGLMTNGIGVGLQSDGAGNWNLATLSNTTVTEGASSGLTDGKTARIEIEKDLSGAYWYYIYDAAGAKPTTATGKLFTSLTEGYTGWYANGAGATTQTYAIENISIRAESIVGRTNVEVTEPFWFRDEFGENSLGRYPKTQISTLTSTISDGEWHVSNCFNTTWTLIPTTLKRGAFNLKTNLKYIATSGATNENSLIVYIYGVRFSLVNNYSEDRIYIGATSALYPVAFGNYDEIEFDVSDAGIAKAYVNNVEVLSVDISSSWIDAPVTMLVAVSAGVSPSFDMQYLQISGTRVYQKPIHRGAMLETYHDGTQEVVGTTFIDDCNWERLDEYQTAQNSVTSFTWGSADAVYVCDHTFGSGLILPIAFTDGYVSFKIKRSYIAGIVLRSDGVMNPSESYLPLNGIFIDRGVYVNGTKVVGLTPVPLSVTNYVYVEVLVDGTSLAYWVDGVKLYSGTVPEIATGYDKIMIISYGNGNEGFGHNKTHIKDLNVVAASPDATNGIAACIPPIGGGARYGVEESVYIPITPGTEIPVGSAVISPNAKSTVVGTALTTFAQTPAGVSASLEYATGTKACPSLSTAFAPTGRHRVKADRNTLTNIGVKGSAVGTSPAVYIDSLHVRKQEVA